MFAMQDRMAKSRFLALLLPERLKVSIDAALAQGSRPLEVLVLLSRLAPGGGITVAVANYLEAKRGA